jgi:hypothetical protein
MSFRSACTKPISGAFFMLLCLLPLAAHPNASQDWNFKVYLDDTPIGYHNFSIEQAEGVKTMSTLAQLDVTFLKIPLFRYRHENTETWSNQCLESITSITDQNGDEFRVQGSVTQTGFQVSANDQEKTLPPCISTFAYWDKSFLRHTRLLNSQTGEYLEVEVEDLGERSIAVNDATVSASHYRLTAEDLDIELWYASDGQWLGLESTTGKGRRLRYVIE